MLQTTTPQLPDYDVSDAPECSAVHRTPSYAPECNSHTG